MARASATRCCWPPESCGGPARGEVVEFDEPERLVRLADRVVDLATPQAEGDVLEDRHVREQRVALEDRVDRPLERLRGVTSLPPMRMRPAVGSSRPGDESQRRRLAAARRAEQGEERPGGDREVEILDGGESGEPLGDADELEVGARLGERCPCRHQTPSSTFWNSAPGTSAPLLRGQGAEDVRLRQRRLVGEDQLVVGELGIDGFHRLLRADDRSDVVHPGGHLGGDLGLVVVVDELLGVRLARSSRSGRGSCRSRACRRPRGWRTPTCRRPRR